MDNLRDTLALWSVPGVGSMNSKKLIAYAGSAQQVFKLKKKDLLRIPGIGEQLINAIQKKDYYQIVDKELEFVEKYSIKITTINDNDYPYRLKQCEDCPLILFSKGQPLNDKMKYLSIVGTRSATSRGIEFCNQLIQDLKERGHNVVIVSGLAFGIDVAAHKAALKNELPTYGILAHGLDTIYPAAHRNIATQMVTTGGLVTEFIHGIFPDKNNFVRRNRVIAGLSDATIVVESDVKGGSLITADLANSYCRDVFAMPGRLGDRYSRGCNKLIKSNRAALIESVEDIEYIMGWDAHKGTVQKKLFAELTPEEEKIMHLLNQKNELGIDEICRASGYTMAKVSALLLNMEFSGWVKCLPGKVFIKA